MSIIESPTLERLSTPAADTRCATCGAAICAHFDHDYQRGIAGQAATPAGPAIPDIERPACPPARSPARGRGAGEEGFPASSPATVSETVGALVLRRRRRGRGARG